VPPGQPGGHRGHADPVENERAFPAQEFDGVRRERLQLRRHAGLGLDHGVGDRLRRLLDAAADLPLAQVHHAAVQPQLGAVPDGAQHVGADVVDDRHAGPDQDLRPEVGEPAGDRRRGVDHGGDLGRQQGVGGPLVQVDLVEHRDVAGRHPL
jgi:hypothetical protein